MDADYLVVLAHRPVPVVRLDGDIDLANAPALATRLLELVPDDGPGLVLDLTRTPYLDSAGVRSFFTVARQLGMRGQHLALVITNQSPIWRLLKTTRVEEVAPLYDSVDAALRHGTCGGPLRRPT